MCFSCFSLCRSLDLWCSGDLPVWDFVSLWLWVGMGLENTACNPLYGQGSWHDTVVSNGHPDMDWLPSPGHLEGLPQDICQANGKIKWFSKNHAGTSTCLIRWKKWFPSTSGPLLSEKQEFWQDKRKAFKAKQKCSRSKWLYHTPQLNKMHDNHDAW